MQFVILTPSNASNLKILLLMEMHYSLIDKYCLKVCCGRDKNWLHTKVSIVILEKTLKSSMHINQSE